MEIQGLQKMTLLDYPGKVACTVFLSGCNFRCPFCHNSELLDDSAPAVMDDQELLRFLKSRVGMLEGVVFTGGEPLMRKDLPDLLRRVKDLGYPIKLDTNGAFPDRLEAVIRAGLVDYVAMDIKNSPERYAETCGLPFMGYRSEKGPEPASLLEKVEKSKNLLIDLGNQKLTDTDRRSIDYEFRTTVLAQLHDAEAFRQIGAWIRGAKRYYLQPFTDRDTVVFAGLSAPSKEEMKQYAAVMQSFVQEVGIRGMED